MTASDTPTLSALLASATWHFHRHEMAAMLRDAVDAREFLDDADEDVRPSAEVVISLFEMAAARVRGDGAAVTFLASRTTDMVDRTPRRMLPAGRHFRVIAQVNLGGAQVWADLPADAEQILSATAPEALELGMALPHLNALGHLALLDALQGRLRRAHRRAAEGMQIIERRGWSSEPQALATFLSLGHVDLARHHLEEAAALVNRGLTASGEQTDRALRLALGIASVQLAVGHGDVEAALAADARLRAGLARTPGAAELLVRWAALAGAQALLLAGRPADALERIGRPGTNPGFAASWERVCVARARLATDQHRVAEVLIEPLLAPGFPYREPSIEARLVQALIAERYHREAAALAALTSAVDLAQPEGIRRPFLNFEGRLTELLLRYQHLGGRHSAFVSELVDLRKPLKAQNAAALMVEHLTERELIVLHYLPTMLKAGEIASDLYVSVNTVKAHLRSMYRKLGVSNRRAAVERARTVGLL